MSEPASQSEAERLRDFSRLAAEGYVLNSAEVIALGLYTRTLEAQVEQGARREAALREALELFMRIEPKSVMQGTWFQDEIRKAQSRLAETNKEEA